MNRDYFFVRRRQLVGRSASSVGGASLQELSTHWIFCSHLTKSLNESCGMGPFPFLTPKRPVCYNKILYFGKLGEKFGGETANGRTHPQIFLQVRLVRILFSIFYYLFSYTFVGW